MKTERKFDLMLDLVCPTVGAFIALMIFIPLARCCGLLP